MDFIPYFIKLLNERGYDVILGNQTRAPYDVRPIYDSNGPCFLLTLMNTKALSTGRYDYENAKLKDPQVPDEYVVDFVYPAQSMYIMQGFCVLDSHDLNGDMDYSDEIRGHETYVYSLYDYIFSQNTSNIFVENGYNLCNDFNGVSFKSSYEGGQYIYEGSFELNFIHTHRVPRVVSKMDCVDFTLASVGVMSPYNR